MDPTLAAVMVTAAVSIGGSWFITRGDRQRMKDLEDRVETLWKARELDAIVKRKLGDHIMQLEHHIWQKLPPPPPERPDNI